MARVKRVSKARGKQKCCHVEEHDGRETVCGQIKKNHDDMTTLSPHVFVQGLYDCGKCGKPIELGTSFYIVSLKTSPYSSHTMRRHVECGTFKPSELTGSPHRAAVYAAQEDFDATVVKIQSDDGGDPDAMLQELKDAATAAAEAAQEAVDSLNESADNIEEGFGHETEQSMECRDRAENLESMIDELSNWDGEDFSGDDEDPEEVESWFSDQLADVQDLVGNLDAG